MKVDHLPLTSSAPWAPPPGVTHTPLAKLGPSGGDQVRLWEGVGDALSRCHALRSHTLTRENLV
eukprot:scaffold1526_cov48-Phaeocystis_antarctica.AAC.1